MKVVAALFAVDPSGLGGVALRAPAGEPRDAWLALLKRLLPPSTPQRRIPLNINDTALLGGLDLAATLSMGRPVAQKGVLAQSDGGVVLLAMAERLPLGTAARLAGVLDTKAVAVQRDGLALTQPARLGVVALDEGIDDEQVPAALLDRMAFLLRLNRLEASPADDRDDDWSASDIAFARELLPRVEVSDEVVQALCAAALALGVYSLRAPILAVKAARCAAALDGLLDVNEAHTALAARLVLAPRATQLPPASADTDQQPDQTKPQPEQAEQPPDDLHNEKQQDQQDQQNQDQQNQEQPDPIEPPNDAPPADELPTSSSQAMADNVLDAAQAAIPQGLLAALRVGQAAKARTQLAGRSGAVQKSQTRGRPMGARRGEPRAGARLNVIETLRAAAPWQKLRQLQSEPLNLAPEGTLRKRVHVQREDFHVTRFKQLSQTTTVFVVDASGSSALNRLAEAKGAVELLLADCYVRRDHVAVLAFRGKSTELLLPPTRSLARAKRSLAGLPGGGATPLAGAIDAARELCEQIRRRGETPVMVLLTDGRANMARDGSAGRAKAALDAIAAARQLRLAGITTLLLDTSAQPDPAAQALAVEMGAAYVPLPHAGAQAVSRVVQFASAAAR